LHQGVEVVPLVIFYLPDVSAYFGSCPSCRRGIRLGRVGAADVCQEDEAVAPVLDYEVSLAFSLWLVRQGAHQTVVQCGTEPCFTGDEHENVPQDVVGEEELSLRIAAADVVSVFIVADVFSANTGPG
jgi:hypothetical protein